MSTPPDSGWKIGTALVDRTMLRSVEKLWAGGFTPDDLAPAELALRAFLVAPSLVVSRLSGDLWDDFSLTGDDPTSPLIEYEEAFNDQLLDYEFIYPRDPHPFVHPSERELTTLSDHFDERVIGPALAGMPRSFTMEEALAYLEARYKGQPLPVAPPTRPDSIGEDAVMERFLRDKMRDAIHQQAGYIVGCHRAGLLVFASSPLARLCEEHIFSVWPAKLFDTVDREYARLVREVSGPRIGIRLPPLVALLSSRAERRATIPFELISLREEFARSRERLWDILVEMWTATTLTRQVSILRELTAAAEAIVPTAFRERLDAMQVAIDITSGSVAGVAKSLLVHDRPNARVSAISFAKQLSGEFRSYAKNHHAALTSILSPAELSAFGTSS